MVDREKVIKGLERCITFDKTFECGADCPYLPTCDAEVEPIDAPKCAGLQLHIDALELLKEQEAAYQGAEELLRQKTILFDDAIKRLKEQEVQPKPVPEELKLKMWNALYAVEDKFEEKYIGTKEQDSWFLIYRPWLQEGFNLAIKAIADWEGR